MRAPGCQAGPGPPKPKRHVFEQQLMDLISRISNRNTEYVRLMGDPCEGSVGERGITLTQLRETRDRLNLLKQQLFQYRDEIKELFRLCGEKDNELKQIRPFMLYTNREHLRQAKARIERQYNASTFRNARDEKVFVDHLNQLERNDKLLGDFDKAQTARREMFDERRQKQKERDACCEEMTRIRRQRDRVLHPQFQRIKAELREVRKDLESLHRLKNALCENYFTAKDKYERWRDLAKVSTTGPEDGSQIFQTQDFSPRSSISSSVCSSTNFAQVLGSSPMRRSQLTTTTTYSTSSAEDLDDLEPFCTQKRYCRDLIKFLHAIDENATVSPCDETVALSCSVPTSSHFEPASPSTVPSVSPPPNLESPDDFPPLNQPPTDNQAPSTSGSLTSANPKIARRRSKRARKRANQCLPLPGHVVDRFNALEISPPKTYAAIARVIDLLNEKLSFYDCDLLVPTLPIFHDLDHSISASSIASPRSRSDSALASISMSDISSSFGCSDMIPVSSPTSIPEEPLDEQRHSQDASTSTGDLKPPRPSVSMDSGAVLNRSASDGANAENQANTDAVLSRLQAVSVDDTKTEYQPTTSRDEGVGDLGSMAGVKMWIAGIFGGGPTTADADQQTD